MNKTISDIVHALTIITDQRHIDWSAFDAVLSSLEDINYLDEQYEETFLSEFISSGAFYQRGEIIPEAIRHFLANGYDVHAHDGRNGGFALSALCWASYDQHILDAAKVLLDAGAPIHFRSNDNSEDGEPEGLLGDLEFKISGAWSADHDYSTANVLEAYYSIAKAYEEGKDYRCIRSFLDCIDLPLTSVSAVNKADGNPLQKKAGITQFSDSLVLWFGDLPLVVKKYIEFVVNPVFVEDNKNDLSDVSTEFAPIIGAKLLKVRYIDSCTCYLEFSNGYRVIFASHAADNRDRIGNFEIRPFENRKDICDLRINEICRSRGLVYSSTVTEYDEEAVALYCDDGAYLLYPSPSGYGIHQFSLLKCSEGILAEFCCQFPVPKPSQIRSYKIPNEGTAVKFDLEDEFLYFVTTKYDDIEIILTDLNIVPTDYLIIPFGTGKHMEFPKRDTK